MTYVPERGDAIWLDFNPQSGHEQAGRRPACVLSPENFNSKTFAVCCPITNRAKGYPFEVAIPAGCEVTGVILANQIRSMDWLSRHAEFICKLPTATLAEVLTKVRLFL